MILLNKLDKTDISSMLTGSGSAFRRSDCSFGGEMSATESNSVPAQSEIFPNLGKAPAPPVEVQPSTGTAIVAWRPEVVASTQLTAEIIRIAATGLGGDPRRARDAVRRRLYMSPLDKSVPYIVQLEFNDAGGGVRKPTPRTVTKVKIEDDAVEIKVGMLHHHGLSFNVLKQDQKTKVWIPNGSYYCVLLAPNQDDKNQLWKAVPVGLCQASVLGPYNEIQKRNLRPTIPQLPHTLDALGTRRVEFTPTHWQERKFDRSVRGKKVKQTYFHIGYEGGRIVFMDSDSNTPPYKRDATDPTKIAVNSDGSLAFHASIFRVVVTENSYVYHWIGKKGDVVTEGLVPVIEAAEQLDPYQALGQSKFELDPDNIDGRRRALLATLHLQDNPFRLYALGLGVITNKAGDDVVRAVAEKLLAEAATKAAEDMAAEWRALTNGFMTSFAALDMTDILGELEDTPENRNKVRGRRQDPEGSRDFLAMHIERIACRTEEGEGFNWKSPIQRKLRRWIFDEVVKLLVPPPTPAP
jgi:hypothetical protein